MAFHIPIEKMDFSKQVLVSFCLFCLPLGSFYIKCLVFIKLQIQIHLQLLLFIQRLLCFYQSGMKVPNACLSAERSELLLAEDQTPTSLPKLAILWPLITMLIHHKPTPHNDPSV